ATLLLLALLIAVIPWAFPSGYWFRIAALVWVSGLAAVGLQVLMGQAGQVSLGHAGFVGIGAYACAIGPKLLGLPVLACLPLGTWLALNLQDSPSGRALAALHDSEVAARTLGVDVARHKLRAFVLAAVYASVAGSLLGMMNGFVTPEAAGFLASIEYVTMVVI